ALRLTGDLDAAARHSETARLLARIDRLCYSIYNNPAWSVADVQELVRDCEELGLVEEARGWVAVGLVREPADAVLLAARDRLAQKPPTSSRRPAPDGASSSTVPRQATSVRSPRLRGEGGRKKFACLSAPNKTSCGPIICLLWRGLFRFC